MINIRALKNFTRAKKYLKGTVIAGDKTSELFIVLKGEAGIYHKQARDATAVIRSGELFGETAFFLGKNGPGDVIAHTDVYALPIERDGAIDFIKEEPEMAFEIMKALCARLHSLNAHGHHGKEAPSDKAAPQGVAETASKSAGFPLFPEGHGNYQLRLNNEDQVHLMYKDYTCPVCGKEFSAPRVKTSKLVLESTDDDMRNRYKDIEPLYYDVITCPNCLYSALFEMFGNPDRPKTELLAELQDIKSRSQIKTGAAMDTYSVFAGYYLALLCAPKCFSSHAFATAKLLLKLMRLYQDCGDSKMEEETAKKALEAYMYVYQNEEIPESLDQQLCLIIGELYLKLNDLKNAKDFFFKARTNRAGTPLLRNQAENRLMDIREMEGKS